MTQPLTPHKLIIQNLNILEPAHKLINDIEKYVFDAIDDKISNWVTAQDGWEGVFNYHEKKTHFKPIEWDKSKKEDYFSYYRLGSKSSEGFSYYLSSLLGLVGSQPFGIWFEINAATITRLKGKGARPKTAWINYIATQYKENSEISTHFQLHEGSLFLPIVISVESLASCYPGRMDDALRPIDDALKIIGVVNKELTKLLEDAKSVFANPTDQ